MSSGRSDEEIIASAREAIQRTTKEQERTRATLEGPSPLESPLGEPPAAAGAPEAAEKVASVLQLLPVGLARPGTQRPPHAHGLASCFACHRS